MGGCKSSRWLEFFIIIIIIYLFFYFFFYFLIFLASNRVQGTRKTMPCTPWLKSRYGQDWGTEKVCRRKITQTPKFPATTNHNFWCRRSWARSLEQCILGFLPMIRSQPVKEDGARLKSTIGKLVNKERKGYISVLINPHRKSKVTKLQVLVFIKDEIIRLDVPSRMLDR